MRKRPDSGDSSDAIQGNETASSTLLSADQERNGGNGDLQKSEGNGSTSLHEEDEAGSTYANIMRLRKPYRGRKAGIEFSTESSKSRSRTTGGGDGEVGSAGALTAQDIEAERIQAISNRFTPHSGQKVDVNKHMYVPFFLLREVSMFLMCEWEGE